MKLNLCHVISISISQKRKKKSCKNMLACVDYYYALLNCNQTCFLYFSSYAQDEKNMGTNFPEPRKKYMGQISSSHYPAVGAPHFYAPLEI